MINMEDTISWSPGMTLAAIEKEVILRAFRHYRGNKTATANALGIAVRTLDNKLDQYEQDGKTEKEREDYGRIQREEFLKRARGVVPDNIDSGETPRPDAKQPDVHRPAAGAPMESAPRAAAQQAVPLPKPEKVQSVLPQQSAARGSGHRR